MIVKKMFFLILTILRFSLMTSQDNLVINGNFEKLEFYPKMGLVIKDWFSILYGEGINKELVKKKVDLIKMDNFYSESPIYHFYKDASNEIFDLLPTGFFRAYETYESLRDKVREFYDVERNGNGIGLIAIGDIALVNCVISGKLVRPLKTDGLYEVSFDYRVMDFWSRDYTTYGLGIKFSDDPLMYYLYRSFPVVEWTVVPMKHDVGLGYTKPSKSETHEWKTFRGVYRANGDERYISIGLFAGEKTPVVRYQRRIRRIQEAYSYDHKYIPFLRYHLRHPGEKVYDFMKRRGYIKSSKGFDRDLKKIVPRGVIIAVDNIVVREIDSENEE